ncbi:hypothetical protein EMIHUDRAFT_257440, partial [Emiliania huxleyi CCMP1516]|uniref:Glycosyltransferase 2-like domain-containing protein n=2 Tax=Emiliania huxleyi TaxID=2903 RepID=A0A0D3IJK3_EMIH1
MHLPLARPRSPAAQCTVGTASLSVIIPAYDEAERLPRTLEESLAHLSTTRRGPWEIIVVDDGSHDSTLMGVVFAALASTCVRGVPDTQCGFKLLSRRAARELFPSLQIRGWAYD